MYHTIRDPNVAAGFHALTSALFPSAEGRIRADLYRGQRRMLDAQADNLGAEAERTRQAIAAIGDLSGSFGGADLTSGDTRSQLAGLAIAAGLDPASLSGYTTYANPTYAAADELSTTMLGTGVVDNWGQTRTGTEQALASSDAQHAAAIQGTLDHQDRINRGNVQNTQAQAIGNLLSNIILGQATIANTRAANEGTIANTRAASEGTVANTRAANEGSLANTQAQVFGNLLSNAIVGQGNVANTEAATRGQIDVLDWMRRNPGVLAPGMKLPGGMSVPGADKPHKVPPLEAARMQEQVMQQIAHLTGADPGSDGTYPGLIVEPEYLTMLMPLVAQEYSRTGNIVQAISDVLAAHPPQSERERDGFWDFGQPNNVRVTGGHAPAAPTGQHAPAAPSSVATGTQARLSDGRTAVWNGSAWLDAETGQVVAQ